MKVDVVVDIGNTNIKWGRCAATGVTDKVSLPPDDPARWAKTLAAWGTPTSWAVAGVHPQRVDAFVRWLRESGHAVYVVDSAWQLPLRVALERPNWVGIDRLLNAVAANRQPAIIVDAGSAVTVDWLDEDRAFRGGAIFPGLRLMAESLHEHTALLPIVRVEKSCPYLPGLNTMQAIEAGIYYAVAGGINATIAKLAEQCKTPPHVFLTGGDATLLAPAIDKAAEVWPEMTLEGLRLTAEAHPDDGPSV